MVCEGSGVWGLDVDVASEDHAADGVAALTMLVAQHGPIPPRPMTRSGGGGVALFFRHRGEPIHGATGWPAPGIDPRRGKLSVTVPARAGPTDGPWRPGSFRRPMHLTGCSEPWRRRLSLSCGLSLATSPTLTRRAAAATPKPRCGRRSVASPAPAKGSAMTR